MLPFAAGLPLPTTLSAGCGWMGNSVVGPSWAAASAPTNRTSRWRRHQAPCSRAQLQDRVCCCKGVTVGFWVSPAGGSPSWPPSCSVCASGCAAAAADVSSFPSGSGGTGLILSRSPRASAVDLLSSTVAFSAPAREEAKRSSFCCLRKGTPTAAGRIPKSHKDSRTHQFFNCWCHSRGSNPIQRPLRTRRRTQGVGLDGGHRAWLLRGAVSSLPG